MRTAVMNIPISINGVLSQGMGHIGGVGRGFHRCRDGDGRRNDNGRVMGGYYH